jgi:anti-sigma regulatory factor (Ser/Thr protein kinase)
MEQAMGAGDSGARSLVLTYPAVPQSVAAIRAALARFARNSGAPSRIAEAVALAASEAATNVVIHAYRDSAEPGHIEVIGALAADELVITVRDAGGGLRPRSDSPGLGLGLAIIAQIADRLDLLDSPSGGLEVRMYFALPAPDPS